MKINLKLAVVSKKTTSGFAGVGVLDMYRKSFAPVARCIDRESVDEIVNEKQVQLS